MKKINPSLFLIIGISALILVSGCSDRKKSLTENTMNIPVFINPALTVVAYMADASVVDNLEDELSIPWSMTVAVKQISGEKTREVGNCSSILAAQNDNFEPVEPSHHTPYLNALMQCRAITIAVDMAPSNISYLTGSLDKRAIGALPVAMAFIPSKSQQSSIKANGLLKSINDVTPIIGFTQVNDYEIELKINGGSQTMLVLAKGDTNGDQIEDLLMQVINATEGGTYSATRLFVLSRKENDGSWSLLSEY